MSTFPLVLELSGNEKRFGFSVVGGVDEGFRPRIDEIIEGSDLNCSIYTRHLLLKNWRATMLKYYVEMFIDCTNFTLYP